MASADAGAATPRHPFLDTANNSNNNATAAVAITIFRIAAFYIPNRSAIRNTIKHSRVATCRDRCIQGVAARAARHHGGDRTRRHTNIEPLKKANMYVSAVSTCT